MQKGKKSECRFRTVYEEDLQKSVVKVVQDLIVDGAQGYDANSEEMLNLLGDDPETELAEINQEIASLQQDIVTGVKSKLDITELAERVQKLRIRKTELEAGKAMRERNVERINALRASIKKSKKKVLMYDEKMVRNFIEEIRVFPDKLTITVIGGAHEDITI